MARFNFFYSFFFGLKLFLYLLKKLGVYTNARGRCIGNGTCDSYLVVSAHILRGSGLKGIFWRSLIG